ncbi:MAG TPA: sigma-54 dependent transcriptional regulator [Polyangiales bacterium]|nr:sigma-54 dependent transcriptional regulator [Polyangiales bacterium]
MKGRALVVEDDPALRRSLQIGLEDLEFEVQSVSGGVEALAALQRADFDVVLTDLNMPGMNGLALCERVAEARADIPVVVITAFGSLETAVAAIRAGAYDFVTKPIELDALSLVLARAVQHRKLRAELKRLRSLVSEDAHELIGESPAIASVRERLARMAVTDSTVLITGESGTGKEVAAHALHRLSKRARGPFIAVNCAAVPETLIESELFGHEKGAFTDARGARAGLLAQAEGGTLFLDELGELPLAAQAKLLRALQERVVRPLGGTRELPFDARILAATNRDLERAVEEGQFREDLFFRIHVLPLELPPLRARGADVLLLAQHFVRELARRGDKAVTGFGQATAERLLDYPWPGNVRELMNCVEHAVALARFEQITPEDLPTRVRSYKRSHVLVASDNPDELVKLEEVERRYILRVLEASNGNKRLAARILGLDRKTLYRKLERYGVS